jgi:hypothetical protein
VPDLLAPSLVEMLAEMDRDLLARKRAYGNRVFTRRLTHERAERRLVLVQAIIDNLRAQLSPAQLQAIAQAREKKERLKSQRRKPATKGTALQGMG